eukprot:TRINITY_DN18932_c0_g1_i1.p1 TRINITY_DN18932_c0_g1~~TRINITY_DN18932_c0_g1_i1.p1  ORF type:complete len:612 (-),score=100.73 TRINITY_DN18932_c0_g1_i1:142-1977(-)
MVAAGPSPVGLMTGSRHVDTSVDLEEKVGVGAMWIACPGSREELMLPFWQESGEQSGHQSTVFGFHTDPCMDFQKGYCQLHRAKGRTSLCFCYHFESQKRRPPVDAASGQLLYWDVPCSSISSGSDCPAGSSCVFAHSREEISYHPAKYKTKRCNGTGCRGQAVCCFAHDEAEMRTWASERYSYWALWSGGGRGRASSSGANSGDWSEATGSTAAYDRLAPGFVQRPLPPARRKTRFCASYPEVSQCRRGANCEFAHSREEAATELLTLEQEKQVPEALTDEFFMYHFKTLWCPIGVQHDWQTCVYAHNYQDARRKVSIGYGPQPCPYWAKKDASTEYNQRCPQGLYCPYAHGAKEQLYHPRYFRTVICRDLRTKACPRDGLCAFFHRRAERRRPPPDDTDYSKPLKQEALPEAWVDEFLSPPFRDGPSGALMPASSDDYASSCSDFNVDAGWPMGAAGASPMEGVDKLLAYWCESLCGEQEILSASDPLQEAWQSHFEELGLFSFLGPSAEPLTHSALRHLELEKQAASTTDFVLKEAKDDTPRTRTGESDSSSSTSRDALAPGERVPGAGVVGAGQIEEAARPFGPFGGPFGSFPGFLALASGAQPMCT